MKKLIIFILVLITYNVSSQTVLKSSTKEDSIKLDTIVLKGLRADKTTPVTQKTITSKDIQKTYSGQEMSIILDKTPSITSNSDGGQPQGYTYFRLRGIDQTRINMTLNGVPLNEPEDQGVYFSNYPNFAKNIKSMQIQRGVGTSTNGVSSFAGSINFLSKSGLNKTTEFELEYGSWGTKRINFESSSGLSKNGKFSSYFNLSYFNTDGYKYHSGGNGYSGFLGLTYYDGTNTFKFTSFSGHSNNQMAWYAVSIDDIRLNPRINDNYDGADDNFYQTLAMIQYKKYINSSNSFNTTIFYNRLDGDWDMYDPELSNILNFRLHSNFYGVIANYNFKPKHFDINLGFSSNRYDRNHSMVILPNTNINIYNNKGYKNEISSYLKVKYGLGNLTLFSDTQYRFTTFKYIGDIPLSNQYWNFLNPKVGLTYTLNKHSNFYATIGKSHREPTRSDMFDDDNTFYGDNLVTFKNVTPEDVLDYELGVNYETKKLYLQSNLYYMNFNNEITLSGALGANSLPQFVNVQKSYRSGLEVDFKYQINDVVTIKYNGSISNNKIIDQGIVFEPLYTPKFINNLSVNLRDGNEYIQISAKHQSKAYIDFSNENTTPQFVVFNLDMGVKFNKVLVKLKVINLFNKEYYTNGYMDKNVPYYYVNATTSVYATINYKF